MDDAPDGTPGTAAAERDLAALIGAVAAGDSAAFRALYDATSPKLFGILLRIIGSRAEAEDVLQDTYVRIWRKAGQYRPEAGKPMAWLAAIARHGALDLVRAAKPGRLRSVDDDDMLERLQVEELNPATRQSLRQCLETLDEESRRCILLAYCSGYSREELAAGFGRPVGTIKTLLHRTVRALKTCLERE
jgi:RNA polymerase sigma-70 factor (ECF subfamily)